MKFFKFALVLVLCIFTEAAKEASTEPAALPTEPNGSSPASPTANPPPAPTKPTTTPPTTTTTKPTTTTEPTTTTKPTTTTTVTTTSKTTPLPTTTAKPSSTTPAPNPNEPAVGSWNVTKPGTDVKCIMARMALQIEVDYEEKNQTKKAILNVPTNATANGTCDNTKRNSLELMWTDSINNSSHYISFGFLNNTNTSEISLDQITVILNGLHTPNETDPMSFFYNTSVFNAPLKHSYKCNKVQTLTLINPKNGSDCKASLTVRQLQVQAFRTTNSTEFEDAIDCIRSTPDVVPIAVGCALAALVVIVLLAYLYGRRRSQARGYLSM